MQSRFLLQSRDRDGILYFMPVTSRIPAAIVIALALVASALAQQPTPQEQQLIRELNQSRAQHGLSPLKVDPRLVGAAREHSKKMAAANTLSHVLPGEPSVAERIADAGVHYSRSGENVGYNTDFNGIQSGFMHSPPHRANILNPDYKEVGIGVARDRNGVYWVTQDFAEDVPQRTARQAEDLAAKSFESMRKTDGLAPLPRVRVQQLQSLTCRMAHASRLDPRAVLSLPGVRNVITYNNSRPENLPQSVQNVARDRALTRFAVAACQTSNATNPGGTYFVVMAFY